MAAVLWRRRPELGHFLSIRDLLKLRQMAARPSLRTARALARISGDLEAWEARAISLARLFDLSARMPRAMDDYLQKLFRYAFLRGLSIGTARLLRESSAAAYLSLIPGAAADYAAGLRLENLFPPAEDLRKILSLA